MRLLILFSLIISPFFHPYTNGVLSKNKEDLYEFGLVLGMPEYSCRFSVVDPIYGAGGYLLTFEGLTI